MSDEAGEFLLLHEIVAAARARLPEKVWDYVVGGAETETTLARNRRALDSIAFRPRVLRDVSALDASASLLGHRSRIPVLLAPVGSLQDLHPDGAVGPARAAARFGVPLMLSSVSPPGLEAVAASCDGPRIFQLYVRGDAAWVDDHVRRAIDAGYTAFCFTVDLDHYSRRERDIARRWITTARRGVTGEEHQARLCWDDIERIEARFDIPVVLKGIATAEDAALACEHGVEAVYVSNHGGRQLDHGRGAIEVLPEIVEAVGGYAEVIVDGGFMRGTDVVKALALGANAVGIGRLYCMGLGAGGEDGVYRVLELLEEEIRTALALLGVNRPAELDPGYLHPAEPVRAAHVASAFPLLGAER